MTADAAEPAADVAAGEQAAKRPGAKKLIVLITGALAVVGASVATTWFLLEDDPPAADTPPPAAAAAGQAEAGGVAAPKLPDKPPLYQALEPVFTASFEDGGRTHYLQTAIQVMARDPKVIDAVGEHMPLVRNAILLRLSEVSLAALATREGREALRKDLLQVVRDSLAQETRHAQVEDLYFTSFVVQ